MSYRVSEKSKNKGVTLLRKLVLYMQLPLSKEHLKMWYTEQYAAKTALAKQIKVCYIYNILKYYLIIIQN